MAKTDRQTDNVCKATWWCITEFKEAGWDILKDNTKWPEWVKTVYGGMEECGTTKRHHFQGAIQCYRQVRDSQIRGWLKTGAHIEPARSKEALQKYAMKQETAIGEKVVQSNSKEYWTMERSMCEIALYHQDFEHYAIGLRERGIHDKNWEKEEYWFCVRQILRKQPFRASTFAQPQMEKFWINTRTVWIDPEARALVLQPEPDQGPQAPRDGGPHQTPQTPGPHSVFLRD